MNWVLVIIAGFFEVGFALCMKESKGFTQLWPTIGMIAFGAASFIILNLALKDLPVGSAYAVWTGIGAAGTAILGIILLSEAVTFGRLLSIAFIVVGVIGLQLAGSGH
ncbi:MAG: multidrug efflux SMR transporter [Chloroflexi bacterium]|nr:multidrug efflux SMR transporter [Chloroflexota bacterium]OJW04305.1 MAG: QacE family quaternary ammonium compound efflux SMR transporter [Chloroflexi bacterium 54-19]